MFPLLFVGDVALVQVKTLSSELPIGVSLTPRTQSTVFLPFKAFVSSLVQSLSLDQTKSDDRRNSRLKYALIRGEEVNILWFNSRQRCVAGQ